MKHWLKRHEGPWWTLAFALLVAMAVVAGIIVASVSGEWLLRAGPR